MSGFTKFASRLTYSARASFCLILTLAIGAMDYLTGEYGITMLYLLPVYAAAKLLGKSVSRLFTMACVIELVSIAALFHPFDISILDPYFMNTMLQSVELIITGWIISLLAARLPLPENAPGGSA